MAFRITQNCTACQACLEVCPTGAILPGRPCFLIVRELCTECLGYAEEPVCVPLCEPGAIVADERTQLPTLRGPV